MGVDAAPNAGWGGVGVAPCAACPSVGISTAAAVAAVLGAAAARLLLAMSMDGGEPNASHDNGAVLSEFHARWPNLVLYAKGENRFEESM